MTNHPPTYKTEQFRGGRSPSPPCAQKGRPEPGGRHTHLSEDLIKGLQDKLDKAPLGATVWGLFCELSPKEEKEKSWVIQEGEGTVIDLQGLFPKF